MKFRDIPQYVRELAKDGDCERLNGDDYCITSVEKLWYNL